MARSGLTTAVLLLWPRAASAQAPAADGLVAPQAGTPASLASSPAECSASRYVVLSEGSEPLGPTLTAGVMAELGTELQERGLGVCLAENPERPPSAVVQLSRVDPKRVLVDIDDRATDKRISRGVSLASLPPDGHALAIAVAIDELLRASWAELLLQGDEAPDPPARSPSLSAPPRAGRGRRDTREPVAAERTPRDEPADELDARPEAPAAPAVQARLRRSRAAAPWWVVGSAQYFRAQPAFHAFGGLVRAQLALPSALRAGLGLRAYHALRVTDPSGSSAATGVGAELSAGACLTRSVKLCADAVLTLDGLRFTARANRSAPVAARDRTTYPVTAAASLGAEWPADTPLFGRFSLDLGVALHGVEARSEDGALLGLGGFVLGAGLGLGVRP